MESSKQGTGLVDLLAGSFEFGWLLSRVRVFWASVDLQLFDHRVGQFVLWQHAANGMVKQVFGLAVLTIAVAFQTQARVSGVPRVMANIHLATCHRDFFDIGNNDKVTAINVRRVFRAMLAHQNDSDIACQTAQDFVRGVYDVPLFFDLARFGHESWLSDHVLQLNKSVQFGKSSGLAAQNQVLIDFENRRTYRHPR